MGFRAGARPRLTSVPVARLGFCVALLVAATSAVADSSVLGGKSAILFTRPIAANGPRVRTLLTAVGATGTWLARSEPVSLLALGAVFGVASSVVRRRLTRSAPADASDGKAGRTP